MSCSHCETNYDANDHCPRVLRCGHVLCSQCLQGIQHHQPSNASSPFPTTTFRCPRDKIETRVPSSCPEDAIRALPQEREIMKMYQAAHVPAPRSRQCQVCEEDAHPATHHCVNCDEWFCSVMAMSHKNMRIARGHIVEAIDESASSPAVTQSIVCWNHDRPFEGYDALCQRAVCTDCLMDSTHRGHNILTMEEAAEQSRGQLRNSVEVGDALLRRLSSFQHHHNALNLSLRESFDKTNALIRASFSKVRRVCD